jgi:hypothetical protein
MPDSVRERLDDVRPDPGTERQLGPLGQGVLAPGPG